MCRVIIVWVYSNVRHFVVDVLRLAVRGEIVFAESDDEILFGVSEKHNQNISEFIEILGLTIYWCLKTKKKKEGG